MHTISAKRAAAGLLVAGTMSFAACAADVVDANPEQIGSSGEAITLGSALGPVYADTTCGKINGVTPGCTYSTASDMSFVWTAPAALSYVISVGNANFDHVLSVAPYTNPTAPLACADGVRGTAGESVTLALDAGQQILITVDGYAALCGSFTLNIDVKSITVQEGQGGSWSPWVGCPAHQFVYGYSMRVQSPQGSGDDTGLNAVRLSCASAANASATTIEPNPGLWGTWYSPARCDARPVVGAMVANQPSQGAGDDTASNDVHMKCLNGPVLQAAGETSWGVFPASFTLCPSGWGVCGASVRVEPDQGSGDDTAMNGLKLACCPLRVGDLCGAQGQGCCGNQGCDAGLMCSGGQCVPPCGGQNQPCCAAAEQCSAGLQCYDGTCEPTVPCGEWGQACCSGDGHTTLLRDDDWCYRSLTCMSGTCQWPIP